MMRLSEDRQVTMTDSSAVETVKVSRAMSKDIKARFFAGPVKERMRYISKKTGKPSSYQYSKSVCVLGKNYTSASVRDFLLGLRSDVEVVRGVGRAKGGNNVRYTHCDVCGKEITDERELAMGAANHLECFKKYIAERRANGGNNYDNYDCNDDDDVLDSDDYDFEQEPC